MVYIRYFWQEKSSNIRSYTVYIYGSGQPYKYCFAEDEVAKALNWIQCSLAHTRTHTHIHSHTHTHTHTHTHKHTYNHTRTHIQPHTHTYTNTRANTHIHAHTYTHTPCSTCSQTNMGTAELKAEFGSKRHELSVSTQQMCILLLFNSTDRLSYAEVCLRVCVCAYVCVSTQQMCILLLFNSTDRLSYAEVCLRVCVCICV